MERKSRKQMMHKNATETGAPNIGDAVARQPVENQLPDVGLQANGLATSRPSIESS
jgi:hypothetical protein